MSAGSGSEDRIETVRQVVDDYLRRRTTDDTVSEETLRSSRPDLEPELSEALRRARLIGAARAAGADDDEVWIENTTVGLLLHCPACRHGMALTEDAEWERLVCRQCGERVHLAGGVADAPPRMIGRFELLERVGTGGFGSVWRAHDDRLRRDVAVKIPRRGRVEETEVEGFLREARIAAQVRHPNVVSVHEVGRDGLTVYIVSEFVRGVSLSRWRRTKRPDFRESAALCVTIAGALHHAHEVGVVHRDLKPENVMMDELDQPHLTDFGLAHDDSDEITMSRDGRVLGTPAYMPPEQARGDSWAADRRSDVWSLGVVLYELLTDELPFRGNPRMMIEQVIRTQPVRPGALNAAIPRDLETICLRCMEKEPARRYPSAKAVAQDLTRFLDGHPIAARPVPAHVRLWLWCRRNPLVPALSLSLLIVVVMTYILAWVAFDRVADGIATSLTTRALEANAFAADSVAAATGRELERRFLAVESLAGSPELGARMEAMLDDPSVAAARAVLCGAAEEGLRDESRRGLCATPSRIACQTLLQAATADLDIEPFCWFVCGPEGLQLARLPLLDADTIGRSYRWRSYFHGHPDDLDREPAALDEARLEGTRLSSVFLTERTDEWVVAISAPVIRDGRFLGVLGLMMELGGVAALPHGEDGDEQNRFAIVADGRTDPPGRVLQHPRLAGSGASRRELLDLGADPAYCLDPAGPRVTQDHRDPLDRHGSRADRRWLAARAPVLVERKSTGLFVVVQESYDELLGHPLTRLRRTLVGLSLGVLLLIAVLTVPLWFLIWRLVARQT